MSKPLRILSLIPYKVLPARLGGEKGIALFNEYLCRHVPLTAVSTRDNDPAYAKGYELLPILSRSRLRYINPLLFFRLRRLLRSTKATHLITEHPYYAWLAWLLRRSLPIRWVIHGHNIEFQRSRSIGRRWWPVLRWYEGWACRSADLVYFISEEDRQTGIRAFRLNPSKTLTVTYGIRQQSLPPDLAAARTLLCMRHGIPEGARIMLFNGALYHATNYEALDMILQEINPRLMRHPDFSYRILICGQGLPDAYRELQDYADRNIIYAGFVEDIDLYFKGADIFLNPILTGGGVKTKAIEAISMNCTVVSTELGAMGLDRVACGDKLIVTPPGDWDAFVQCILEAPAGNRTSEAFFQYYHWGHIVRRAVDRLPAPKE